MISALYRGSVKDILGPIRAGHQNQVIFEYSDAFSVFDWGRMPDLLPRKGEALAILAAELFEKVEKPEVWREFSRSQEAFALRKSNRFGASFNEIGEELQSKGLRTHYIGVIEGLPATSLISSHFCDAKKVQQATAPFRRVVVQQVSVVKPTLATVLGRVLPDYYPTRVSQPPRLIPLEVVFRFSCPPGSSLIDKMAREPQYLAALGFPDVKVSPEAKWDFPVLELFTKLESTDRAVSLSEALAISGLSASQLQEMLFKTAWVAGFLKNWFYKKGLELADGKLEWAVSPEGNCFLVDAVGPDELRILKNGLQLSKEFLRSFYRQTSWYQLLERAKANAKKSRYDRLEKVGQ